MIDDAYVRTLRGELSELEQQLADPGVAANRKRFQELLADHSRRKRVLATCETFTALLRRKREAEEMRADADADPALLEMADAEIREVDAALPSAEREVTVALLPADPADERPAIFEIRAGTGGDEAALFAGDLHRMYTRYAENRGWTVSVLDVSPAELGGYKEIIFSIEGPQIYRRMKYESGVHRVQRVPATEAQGRIHTSTATVAVLPEADEVDEIDIKPDEIRIDYFRSSGPGGQNVNRTDSAVRITHLATGVVVQCQDEKSQHRNREKAMRVLKARLLDTQRQADAAKASATRRSQIGTGDRSERIRTYNFPQNRVSDHRINLTLYSLDRFIEGSLDEMLDALYDRDLADRMASRTA